MTAEPGSDNELSAPAGANGAAAVGRGGKLDARSAAAATGGHRRGPTSGGTIMVIRHGEKPTGTGAPYGITAAGIQDAKSLTTTGWARAGALVELFAPAVGTVRHGLARPAAVFASNQSGPAGGSAREQETVSLVARRLGLTIHTEYGVGHETQLVAALARTAGPVLVCWEHDHIPAIARDLGAVIPTVPHSWPSARFDVVWVLIPADPSQRSSGSYHFYQVPQLLLPGDLDTPIT